MVNSQSKSSWQPPEPQNAVVSSDLSGDREQNWTVADSAKLYNIRGWGEPYFDINALGNVTVSVPNQPIAVDLVELAVACKQQNLSLPLLIRFPDILSNRIARLHDCMAKAIARYDYAGKYQGVFPIKCNQNRHLIEDVVNYGKLAQFGLEAGSKAELAIALASLEHSPSAQPLLMCNGYKDREYIETAILATKLGQKPIIIIERLQELDLAIDVCQKLNLEPVLGVRAKLATKGVGRWGDSTGDSR